MARIFTASGEELEVSANIWDEVYGGGNFNPIMGLDSLDGNAADLTCVPKSGLGCYKLLQDDAYLRKWFDTSYAALYFGFWIYRPTSLGTVNPYFMRGYVESTPVTGNSIGLKMNTGGTISALRDTTVLQTGSTVIGAKAWTHLQVLLQPKNSGGAIVVYVDGSLDINYSGDTTSDQEAIHGIEFLGLGDSGVTGFDDIVVNDASGSDNNTYPGMVRLLPMRPTAAGNSAQWSRGGVDLGANYRQAAHFAGISMLQTASASQKDTYTMESPDLPAGATITNMIVQVVASVGAGSGSIKPTIRAGTTESQATAIALTSSRQVHQHCLAENPDTSSAWAEGDLPIEMGFESA